MEPSERLATIQATAFGTERVPVLELSDPAQRPAATVKMDGPAVNITDASFTGQPGFAQAQAARAERSAAEDSSALVGLGAAISTWDTTRLLKRVARPAFDNDAPVNMHEFMSGLDFAPTVEEDEYIRSTAKGVESAKYAVQQVRDLRKARAVAGNHELVGTLAAFMDPVWLGVPPALKLGRAVPVAAGRVASATAAGAFAGAVTAGGEGPRSDEEIILAVAMNSALGAVLYKGGKLVQADPEFPKTQLQQIVGQQAKPMYKLTSPAVRDAGGGVLKEATYTRLPDELQPGAVNTDLPKVAAAVERELSERSGGVGAKLMWNMHKQMESFGPVGKRVADLLLDNNKDLGLTSVESHQAAILGELRRPQFQYEELMMSEMAARGFGTLKMALPNKASQAYRAQADIEKAVHRELLRREQFHNKGVPVPASEAPQNVVRMADQLDSMHKTALAELKAAGVDGAETLLERPGYLNRRWSSQNIDSMLQKLENMGVKADVARTKVDELVGMSLRLANPRMGDVLAKRIGAQIVDRALRKGMFEDTVFNSPANVSTIAEMRDFLKSAGLRGDELERGLEVMRVSTDEAGKAAYMKHRLDLDYKATMRIGKESFNIMDLLDSRVTSIVDQYNQRVATSAAFARKGFKGPSDLEKLRQELLQSLPEGPKRTEAKELFDNLTAYMRGDPAGAKLNQNFRLMMSYGRAVSLAWSGLWQFTEYANVMADYGMRKSLKYAIREIPGFSAILKDKQSAGSLTTVLSEYSQQSNRLRPYLAKFEDGHDIDTSSALQLSAQRVGQLVPMANAMKYVHHAQANAVSNLILDRLELAAKGNKSAREALAKYGIDAPVMDKVRAQIDQHGFEVDAWDDAVWMQVRPAFAKMMDYSVVKARLGDMPAFAVFDPVGKFVFTYRTFVLAAHNKVLAGGMARNGAAATGLVLLYQFPLAMAAVQAQAYVRGEGTLDEDKLVKTAVGQMGGLGLFSEPFKWASGQSNSIGAPALIPADRAVKAFQAGVQGDGEKLGSTLATMIPVFSAVPFVNGMAHRMKEQ
jgi:hypothetical protein